MDCDTYRAVAVEVKEGQTIPGTSLVQRFSTSFFLPRPAPIVPFVQFLKHLRDANHASSNVLVVKV